MQECENAAGGVSRLSRPVSRDRPRRRGSGREASPPLSNVFTVPQLPVVMAPLSTSTRCSRTERAAMTHRGPASPAVNLPVALPAAPPSLQIYRY